MSRLAPLPVLSVLSVRSAILLLPLSLLACGDKEDGEGSGGDGWFDEDDEDMFDDTGGSGAGEEGGGVGGGTDGTVHPDPYEGLSCDDGLDFQAQSRDAGGYCTVCAGDIHLYAVIYNPCPEPLSFTTTGGLVVDGMYLEGPGGADGMGSGGGGGEPMEVEVAAESAWEEYLTGDSYPPGPWTLEVSFGDTENHEATHTFEVLDDGGTGSGSGGGTGGSGSTGAADSTTGDGEDSGGDGSDGGSSGGGSGSGSSGG